jgi:hypothetical protein
VGERAIRARPTRASLAHELVLRIQEELPGFRKHPFCGESMDGMSNPKKGGPLRAAPRLTQILPVVARHKCLGILLGKSMGTKSFC